MSENITREELHAVIETQTKATEQMVTIANYLKDIVAEQKKISESLSNGIKQDILEGMLRNCEQCSKVICADMIGIKNIATKTVDTLDSVSRDVDKAKWFIAIIGLSIIVATVVLRGIDNRSIYNKELTDLLKKVYKIEQKSDYQRIENKK